ncbi:MAG TPA: GrpB family protein [Mycobacteriales bacterium]
MSEVVVPPDPEWRARFESEREALEAVLRPWLVAGIHHIGSTSIPRMPAKPILDMMAGALSLACAPEAGMRLAELGYRSAPHRIDAALFVKGTRGADTHHLHLTMPESDLWIERLTFRDAVRADPRLAQEYAELKQRLLVASGGRPYDAAGKRDFVRRVLAGAGVTLRDGLYSRQ